MKPLLPLLLLLALSAGAAHAQTSTATISQSGDAFEATVHQMGGPGNAADITQVGDHGLVLLDQVGAGNEATLSSLYDAVYGGSHNTILLSQTGGAEAVVSQSGSYNTVQGLLPGTQAASFDGSLLDVTQTGYGNTLWLDQHNGSAATVVQTGTDNTATIIQH